MVFRYLLLMTAQSFFLFGPVKGWLDMCWLALGMRVNPDTRTIITNFKYFTYAA